MNTHPLHIIIVLVVTGLLLTACGGGSSTPGSAPEAQGLLKQVRDAAELEASLKSGFTTVHPAETVTSVDALGSASTRTYTQEPDVDEFDSVKYDGTHLYVAPMRGHFDCCFLAAEVGAAAPPPPAGSGIRIFATDPTSGEANAVAEIPLEEGVSVQGMYLTDERLVALTAEAYYDNYGDSWANIGIWAPETTGLRVYDTRDATAPALLFEARFDGLFVDSRRVGDTVYVVTRFAPSIDGIEYNVTSAAQAAANETLLDGITLAELLPSVNVNGNPQALLEPEDCFVTNDGTDPGYPVITSITAIPVADPAAFTTTCYNEDAYGTYVSPNALYLAQQQLGDDPTKPATRLHKFALSGGAPAYAGSADVDGLVWIGGQTDFRLNEYEGDLRVFTSVFDSSASDFVDYRLYVLRESAGEPRLDIVSTLPNDTRPEEIGKPNESLYGVRFLGKRAYAVTFERIDPLYVLDLEDPADPRIAGTLAVTGFSDFLHPVTSELLLGLGTGAEGGIKLELYDVSDLARPLAVGSETLGGRGSSSEATWNRHAFTYLADVNGVDRFTVPVDLTAVDGSFQLVESGLRLYEIHDKTTPNLAALKPAGAIVTHSDGRPFGYPTRSRSVLHDDAVYYIRDENVFSVLWNAPGIVNGPF